jgi:hypothetical protein
MLNTQFLAVLVGVTFGAIMLFFGCQYLFNTEIFVHKLIESRKMEKDSPRYKFMMSESNSIFYKFIGIGFFVGGVVIIILPILRLLSIIH